MKVQKDTFIPFSNKLAEELTPDEFFYFYNTRYYETMGPDKLCFASDEKMMLRCNFRTKDRLFKNKNSLLDKGLILKHTRPHKPNAIVTLYKLLGKGLRTQFILNTNYTNTEKIVLIIAALNPGKSARQLAAKCRVSKSGISRVLKTL